MTRYCSGVDELILSLDEISTRKDNNLYTITSMASGDIQNHLFFFPTAPSVTINPLTNDIKSPRPSHALRSPKATSSGILKLIQNILFFGATSLTSQTLVSNRSPCTSFTPNFSLALSQISMFAASLSSFLGPKQCTCTIGNFVFVCGVKRCSDF